jgi:hypothetical protein
VDLSEEEQQDRFHMLDDPSADPEDRKMAGFFADGLPLALITILEDQPNV